MMKAYLERFLSNGGPIPLPPEIMNGKASLKTQIKGDVLPYGINLRHLISTGIFWTLIRRVTHIRLVCAMGTSWAVSI